MPNPLFSALGGGMGGLPPQFQQLVNNLYKFRSQFNGNPQQIVMNAVQSGRISQQQLNQAQNMATQIQRMLTGGS